MSLSDDQASLHSFLCFKSNESLLIAMTTQLKRATISLKAIEICRFEQKHLNPFFIAIKLIEKTTKTL